MWKSIAIGAILAALAAPALAEDAHHPGQAQQQGTTSQSGQAGPGMMGQGMMGPGMMMDCPMVGMMKSGKPRTEGHLAFLKAELQISGKQEKAWTAYASAVRGIQKRMSDKMATMGPGMMMQQGKRKPAPEAIQMHIQMMEAKLENLKTLQSATAQLYGALNEDQKATADELLACCMGAM
jgi:hypothetical protein